MKELLRVIIYRLEENYNRVQTCFSMLSKEEVWTRPNEQSNSAGNLVLHLNGNITQYIISTLGGSPDRRARDNEFNTTPDLSLDKLLEAHETVISGACSVIRSLGDDQLQKRHHVQGFEMTGVDILVHVVEHYSYHTGQIALLTKLSKNEDLGFYKGVNLNVRGKY